MFCEHVQPVASISSAGEAVADPDALTARIYPLDPPAWGMQAVNGAILDGKDGAAFRLPGFGPDGIAAFRARAPDTPFGMVIDGYIALRARTGLLTLRTRAPHEMLVGGVRLQPRGPAQGPAVRLGAGIYGLALTLCLRPRDPLPLLTFAGRTIQARDCFQTLPGW